MKISRYHENDGKLRVLLVCPHIKLPGIGGAATHHTEFSRALASTGAEIHILADTPKEKRVGDIFFHKSASLSLPPDRFWSSLLTVKKAVDICKDYKINVIHDRCDPGQVTGYLTSKISGIPRVSEINYNFLSYEIKMSFFRDKIIFPFLCMIKKTWIKSAVKSSAMVVSVSKSIERSLDKQGIKNITTITNGADPHRFKEKASRSNRKKYGLKKDDFVLAVVGELGPRQHIIEVVRSMKIILNKIPDVKLLLVGGEERYKKYLDGIKSYVDGNKMGGKVIFMGKIDNREVPEFLGAIDVALCPYSESWGTESFGFSPIKVFEYMAAGKTVIASDTEWMREIITSWKDGILLKSFDDITDVLTRLKSNNCMSSELGPNARKKVVQRFNWDIIAKSYRSVYKKII